MTRPWYHRPEWIALAVTGLATLLGGASAVVHSDAATAQNTKDIAELQRSVASVPERLARIEQKVDDLKTIEVQRHGRKGE